MRSGTPTMRMTKAALDFLDALDSPRRDAVLFPFESRERFDWNYRPDGVTWEGDTFWHEGLRLVNMTPPQQTAAFALLESALSNDGAKNARAIISLEEDLRLAERIDSKWVPHVVRDPELYAFAIFGRPGGVDPWMWRVGGHHLGLHFTVVGDDVTPTPLFFGANPAEIRHGPRRGRRTLPSEEDEARALLLSLPSDAQEQAIFRADAPHDILTDAFAHADRSRVPSGLAHGDMADDARARLLRLGRLYVDRASPDIAAAAWARIERAGLDAITFAWAGGVARGAPHYYAIKGPTFLIEYDNTQDAANHVHSVWREFDGDWGEDLLAAHYRASHS